MWRVSISYFRFSYDLCIGNSKYSLALLLCIDLKNKNSMNMKLTRFYFIFFALSCLFPISVWGTTIYVKSEGSLEQVVENSDDPSFKELKIIGRLNATDIKYLRTGTGRIATIETLDLSEVTIVSGGGEYSSISYSDNEVTMDKYKITFYSSEDNKKDTTMTSNMMGGNNYAINIYCNNLAGAFANMKYKKVIMPQNVQEIGVMTFYQCKSLESVEVATHLEVICDKAFEECSALQDLDLSHVKEMGSKAFYNCGSFRGNEEGTLDLSSLNSIPDLAFPGVNGIKHITFSSTLNYIGTKAFFYCEQLEEALLPEGLKQIGNEAFYRCTSLSTVTIPSTVEMINYGMFANSPWLKSLANDNGILYINNVAVSYVGKATDASTLTIREGTTAIGDDFMGGLDDKHYFVNLSLPSSLQKIGERAFSGCSSLTSLVLPEGLTSIRSEAFKYCRGITTLTLPTSLTEIGAWAFYRCSGLTTLELSSKLRKIGREAFYECSALTSLAIPESVKEIGSGAFSCCTSLSGEVTIPAGVERLGRDIFYNANVWRIKYLAENAINMDKWYDSSDESWDSPNLFSAERVIIGANVRILPGGFFGECERLKKVTFEERNTNTEFVMEDNCFYGCKNLTSIEALPKTTRIGNNCFGGTALPSFIFPDGLIEVGDYAFSDASLTSVDLGNSVKHIGNSAFYRCNDLESVEFGDLVEYIGDRAFSQCKKLETVDLPNGLTYLGECAFSESGISHISIPGSVRQIRGGSFSECENLASVELGEGIESIGTHAFSFCSALKEIVFPEGFKVFESNEYGYGGYTFRDCKSLKTISLPSTLENLGSCTFSSVVLETITCNLKEPISFVENVFSYWTYRSARLIVPTGTKKAYQSISYWNNFKNIEEMASSTDFISIGDIAITAGHTQTIEVNLKNEVTDYTAYQFDLVLPAGFDIPKNASGKWDVMKGSRYEDDSHSLTIEKVENNKYRFLCVSTNNALITDTDGTILTFSLHANSSLAGDEYMARIENIVITRVNEEKNILQSTDVKLIVNGLTYIPGDANSDGTIDITDAVAVINYILAKPAGSFNVEAADANFDGEVDVFDVTKIISIILSNKSGYAASRRSIDVAMENVHLMMNGNGLWMGIDNTERFTAFQFDIEIPEGAELEDVSLTNTESKHNILFARMGERLYKVIGLSMNNELLPSSADRLIEIRLSANQKGNISIRNIMFVNKDAEKTFFNNSDFTMGTTGISSIVDEQFKVGVYDLSGRKLDIKRGQLGSGVYIVNGNKVVIK